jgi:hypothetical protein
MRSPARPIVMPPLGPALTTLWHLLFELSVYMPVNWCLIGGQMVLLHGLEQGRTDARPTVDGDVLVDVRAASTALRQVADFFVERSFEPDPGPDGNVHRFKRLFEKQFIVLDVLAPDNLGPRVDLTTRPPGRTLEAPGGTQALARVETIEVVAGGRVGEIPRPNLVGAILMKASALNLPGGAERHVTDLAFLLSLLTDPVGERLSLSAGEKMKLRRSGLLDRDGSGWRSLPVAQANAGYAALRLLIS